MPVSLLHGSHISPENKWNICDEHPDMKKLRSDPLCQRLAENEGKIEELFQEVGPEVLQDGCKHA